VNGFQANRGIGVGLFGLGTELVEDAHVFQTAALPIVDRGRHGLSKKSLIRADRPVASPVRSRVATARATARRLSSAPRAGRNAGRLRPG
jgi:hypothetical protein